MTRPSPTFRLPAPALREFEEMEGRTGQDGLPLLELLNRVNRVAAQMLPEGAAPDARVSSVFSERTFRRYQTLGCIDPPERAGRRVRLWIPPLRPGAPGAQAPVGRDAV